MSLLSRFRNASIRTKYLLAVGMLLLCLFLCGLYAVTGLYRASYAGAIGSAEDSLERSYEELTRFEERLNHLATLLQCDSATIRMLSGTQSFSMMEYLRAKEDLLPKLYSMQDGSGDYFCCLYVDSSLDLLDRSSRIRLLNDVAEEAWAQESLTGWGFRRFYDAAALQADRPALIAPLRRLDKLTEHVALLRIDISPSALERMLTLSQGDDYTSCLLLSPSGERLAVSGAADDTDYGAVFSEAEWTGFSSYRLNERTVNGSTVFSRRLSRSGWLLVTTVQNSLLNASITRRYSFLAAGAFCMALAGILCALPILWVTTSRIRRFSKHVQDYNRSLSVKGVTPARLETHAEDEIGLLIREHNAMLDRIDALVEDKARNEEERRQLELTALQAQIKPHFLYNTLETITWMARMQQPDKVEQTVFSLTRFYRLCLSRGCEVLPLEKELEIVRHYFAIAGTRYGSAVTLRINVPAELLSRTLPKITLQPLVENALNHGVMESETGTGKVAVTAGQDANGAWFIRVTDTGGHFSPQVWEKVMNGSFSAEAGEEGGYGLRNVERRLCLYYGRSPVLRLEESRPNLTSIIVPLS